MNGQDWPVGTVATATVRGVEGVRVMRTRILGGWVDADGYGHTMEATGLVTSDPVTDVRPLLVLDPETLTSREERGEVSAAAEIVVCLRKLADEDFGTYRARVARRLADQIEEQTKPPRIPEPGLWGVVKANIKGRTERGRFVHDGEDICHYWEAVDWNGTYTWSDLVDPVELRPGIEDES